MRSGCRLLNPVEKPRRREDAGERGAECRIVLDAVAAIGAIGREDGGECVAGEWPTPGARGEGKQRLQVRRQSIDAMSMGKLPSA